MFQWMGCLASQSVHLGAAPIFQKKFKEQEHSKQ